MSTDRLLTWERLAAAGRKPGGMVSNARMFTWERLAAPGRREREAW